MTGLEILTPSEDDVQRKASSNGGNVRLATEHAKRELHSKFDALAETAPEIYLRIQKSLAVAADEIQTARQQIQSATELVHRTRDLLIERARLRQQLDQAKGAGAPKAQLARLESEVKELTAKIQDADGIDLEALCERIAREADGRPESRFILDPEVHALATNGYLSP